MRIIQEVKLDYKDVLIVPKRSVLSSRNQVELKRTFKFRSGHEWSGIPIVAANMDGVGTLEMDEELSRYDCLTALTKHYEEHDLIYHFGKFLTGSIYSMGITDKDLNVFKMVWRSVWEGSNEVPKVCIDVANGYTQSFLQFVEKFRLQYPRVILIAGNVVTPEMTEELILSGVDIVKVGIGPGSVCTTRMKTGIGYPQLSAVIECADAAHGLKGHIMADGGCSTSGDIAKAFAAGADFVMIGGMLAGHKEGGALPNTTVTFYGMSSDTAMNLHNGGVASYRAAEGKTITIPYRGGVASTLQDLLGGLRSTCTYVGAAELKHLSRRATFVKLNT